MPETCWVTRELADVELGDKRLDARLITLVSALAAAPEASLPQACGAWAATKAAYRFLSNERVTPNAIRAAQHSAVIGRARREQTVLVLHDSTDLDFTTQPQMQGLGPLHWGGSQGRQVHTGLVTSLHGLPLGILWQQTWSRDPDKMGQSHACKKRDLADKESRRWLEGLQATHAALPNTVHSINVGDRGADMYPLLVEARPAYSDYIIRSCYDRRISEEAHTIEAALALAPCLGQQTVPVARRKGEAAREAVVEVRAATVTLLPPSHYKKGTYAPVAVQVVLAQEVAPPAGVAALRWVLLTSLPVADLAAACTILRYYAYRWLIERYHFVLKSGCRLERLQLETVSRLDVALALYNIVAWRLLWLTYLTREHPEGRCEVALQTHEWQALYATIHKTSQVPGQAPTLRQAVRWIAQLGGFLGRKGDGEPGVQTLWRGLQRLHDIAATWRLLHPSTCG